MNKNEALIAAPAILILALILGAQELRMRRQSDMTINRSERRSDHIPDAGEKVRFNVDQPAQNHFVQGHKMADDAPKPADISLYGAAYHGRRTASGTRFDWHQRGPIFTAAVSYAPGSKRPSMPFGSRWKLVLSTGRSIIVEVTDTGSYRTKRKGHQWFDLSYRAWAALGIPTKLGRIPAKDSSIRVTWEEVK